MRIGTVLSSFVVVLALAASPAAAQQAAGHGNGAAPQATAPHAAQASASQGSQGHPAHTAHAATPYTVKVENGIRLIMGHDFDGAIASLREALTLDSSKPDAYYYLGTAQRMKGANAEAVESFKTGTRMAAQANDVLFQARNLIGVADTLERMDDKLDEARAAWQEVMQLANAHGDVVHPEVPRAHIQAIDRVTEQDQAYVAVRQRIAAREQAAQHGQQAQGHGHTGGSDAGH